MGAKKDRWDKVNIIFMCTFTGFIAIGTFVIAFKDLGEINKGVQEIKENFQNLTVSRGRCITPNPIYGVVRYNQDGYPVENAIIIAYLFNLGTFIY